MPVDMDLAARESDAAAAVAFAPAPPLPIAEVARFLSEHYGLEARLTRLAGEKDDNFRVTGANRSYFLKISHPDARADVVDLHTSVLQALRTVRGVAVEDVVPSLAGNLHPVVELGGGVKRLARLTTFLEGRPMSTVDMTSGLREELGRTLARVGRALAGFEHPAARWPVIFDLGHADRVRPLLADLSEHDGHALLAECLDRYCDHVRPRLMGQRRQMIHNDLNGDNLLLSEDGRSIAGLIDFGDAVDTQLVNDVATAMANQIGDGDDPLEPAVEVLRGYVEVVELRWSEVRLLYDLIRTRLVVRAIVGEWRARRDPGNRQYFLRNTPAAWRALKTLPAAREPDHTKRLLAECGWT